MKQEYIHSMINAFESVLTDRMHEQDDRYIIKCLLDAQSPIIHIDCPNGIQLFINTDNYGYNDILRAIHNYDDFPSVFVDGKDIFDWN